MQTKEKRVFYESSNTYSFLNELTDLTENVWLTFHGVGFLSRYFIRHFRGVNATKNYILALQAPSKYYQDKNFKHIGASWLTRENTVEETQNVLKYVDAVYAEENIPASKKLVLFGFSQGVSIVMRWLVSRQIKPDLLVLYAGGIPKELTPDDCRVLEGVPVKLVCGNQDEFITEKRFKEEVERANYLFPEAQIETKIFKGKHEMKANIINELI